MLAKKSATICTLLILSLLGTSPTLAESKGNSGKGNKGSTTSTTSTWVLPSSKSKGPILVQAGRSVPLKFKLIDTTGVINSLEMVGITLNQLDSCNPTAAIKGSPIALVNPTPVVSASPQTSISPSPSNSPDGEGSEKSNQLRIENGVFFFTWKISKSLSGDCYQVVASKGSLVVKSPLFKVRPKK